MLPFMRRRLAHLRILWKVLRERELRYGTESKVRIRIERRANLIEAFIASREGGAA
jgi:hypothetical protein